MIVITPGYVTGHRIFHLIYVQLSCLISKSLKVAFFKVYNFRCQVGAEGCSGTLLLGSKEICKHSPHLGNLIHDLLVDW